MIRKHAVELVHEHEGDTHTFWLECNGQRAGKVQFPSDYEPSEGEALALLLSVPYRQLV